VLHNRAMMMRARFLGWAAGGLLAVTLLAQVNNRPAGLLAITRVAVIDTIKGSVARDVTVVIRGDGIVSSEVRGAVPRGAKVIDGQNRFLVPGFWDMHVHLSYSRVSALPALVANGVTGVRDLGSDLAELDRWLTQVSEGTLIGPTIVRAGPMLNGMEFNVYQLAVADATEARIAIRTLRKVGVDLIKIHRRTPRDAYFAIAEEARTLKLPFSGHIPMAVTPAEASDAGQASIEHTETLFEGTFAAQNAGKDVLASMTAWRMTEAPALFDKFARNGTMVDPTLIAQTYLLRLAESGTPDPRARYIAASARKEADKTLGPDAMKALLGRKALLRELQNVTGLMSKHGVALLAGTDLSYLHPPGFTLQDELVLLVESGLTPIEALRAATLNPARLFPAWEAGSIQPGKRADLVLLDGNPLEDIRNTQRINAVVLRGVYLNRKSLDGLLSLSAKLALDN
jgi:imidazolonepropionase-like amidohydrolase